MANTEADLIVDAVAIETVLFNSSVVASAPRRIEQAEFQLDRLIAKLKLSAGVIVALDIRSGGGDMLRVANRYPMAIAVGGDRFAGTPAAREVVPWLVDEIIEFHEVVTTI